MPSDNHPAFEAEHYDQSAQFYLKGRLGYSPALVRHAAKVAGLGPDTRVLDLGCGPGNIANEIAQHTGQVIGVDPSAAMIDIARQNAPPNVKYVNGSSDDLTFVDTPLQLVTFGRSLHWMNREILLETLDTMVAPDGCLAIFIVSPITKAGKAHDWWNAVKKATKELYQKDDDEGAFGPGWARNEVPLSLSAFNKISDRGLLKWHSWTFRQLVNFSMSRYHSGMGRMDERLPEVEAIIKRALKPYGRGPWKTLNVHRVYIARR